MALTWKRTSQDSYDTLKDAAKVYAAALNQTDRNVRKKMTRLMNRIQKELYTELSGKSNLSLREKEFLAEY